MTDNEESFENNSNIDTDENEKEKNLAKRNKKILIEIVNILLLIAPVVLYYCSSYFYYDDMIVVLSFCFVVPVVILKIIGIFADKIKIVTCIINIVLLSLMMAVSCEYVEEMITYLSFVTVLYNLVYEIYVWISIIFYKYHASHIYKIKCYKKIEQLNAYLEKGIITKEEFEKAREQILSKICYK